MTDTAIDIIARASSLTEWPDCERRWASRHAVALVKAAGYTLRQVGSQIGAMIGTAVHAGAAQMLQHKVSTGEVGNKSSAVDCGIESLRFEVQMGAVWDDTSRTINEAEMQTRRMVEIFHGTVAPMLKPVAIEQEYVARFSPTLRLSGHMDIAEDEGVDDNKTGKMQRPHHPQYGAYALLRRSNGHTVSRFREHWIPRVPANRMQPIPTTTVYPVEACEQAAHAVLKKIDTSVQEFAKTGDAWTMIPNPASMLCSDRFCPAWGTAFCAVHAKR